MRKVNNIELFSVRKQKISSKFFLAPINTGFTIKGEPDERLIRFHSLRSGRKIGISYVGNVAISPQFCTNKNTAYFTKNNAQWENLIEKIVNNGSLPGIQLGCMCSKIIPIREKSNSNIQLYIKNAQEEFSKYTNTFIRYIIKQYIDCAIYAYKTGFKVIQIHAAHGYFLSLSLSRYFNVRKDEFCLDKCLILSEIISGIKEKIPEAILDVRISLVEGIDDKEKEINNKQDAIKEIIHAGVDIVSISNGIYNVDKDLIYPPAGWGHGIFVNDVLRIAKRYPQVVWNVAGNIWDIKDVMTINQANLTFSIGRSLISDPNLIEKSLDGREDEVKKCLRCNKCHYYSNGQFFLNGCLIDN